MNISEDTPQADAGIEQPQTTDVQDTAPENPIEGTEQAPVDEVQKVTFDAEQQAVLDKAIGKQVKNNHDQRRENEALRQQLAQAQAQIPQETAPNIPQMPDAFDDDFDEKVRLRDEAVTRKAQFDVRQSFQQEQATSAQQATVQRQHEELSKVAGQYATNAQSLGISQQEMQQAAQTVSQSGISLDVQQHILADSQGPLISDYLAKNPLVTEQIRVLSPLQAAVFIENNVKSKAQAGRKQSSAPAPATIPNGGGVAPQERGPKGATFV